MVGMVYIRVEYDGGMRKHKEQEFQKIVTDLDVFWDKSVPRTANDLWYYIPDSNELLKELCSFAAQEKEHVNVSAWGATLSYSEEEVKEAVAFIPCFDKNRCNEYYDVAATFDVCKQCGREIEFECSILWNGKVYGKYHLAPKEGMLKQSDNKNLTFYYNSSENLVIISVLLRNNLLKKGWREDLFRAIRTKRGVIVAYELVEAKSVSKDVILECNGYYQEKKCTMCNRMIYKRRHAMFKYEHYYIENDIIINEFDVVKTRDIFQNKQVTLVSPKLRRDILQLDSNAKFLPVFRKRNASNRIG